MLEDVTCPTSASLQHLAEALCSMPNLTDLELVGYDFQEEFYSALNAKALTLKDSFPQISNGNFRFNGASQSDVESFLQALTEWGMWVNVSDEEDGVSDEEDGVSDEEENVSDEDDNTSDEEDGVSDEEDGVSDQEDGVSHKEENVLDEDDNTSDEEDNVSDEKTHRECSSSQSRPLKKKAPSTQSRAPQDDPEIPEKQSKYRYEV
eukprot:XP_011681841.1 PREDICTED: ATP-dependent RNA helicase dbp-8-like [Strongylocentrotus purpuratus]